MATAADSNHPEMTNQSEAKEDITEFVRIGRTGRRNAVADVNMDPNITVSPNSLTELMRNVNCGNNETGESKASL